MECGTTIGWDSLLRRVLRYDGVDPTRLAVSMTMIDIGDAEYECDAPSLLTKYASAVNTATNVLYTQGAADGEGPLMACADAQRPLSSYADEVIFKREGGGSTVLVWDPNTLVIEDPPPPCDYGVPMMTKVAASMIHVGSVQWMWQVVPSDLLAHLPLGCDFEQVGLETLVHRAMVQRANGSWAWRYTVE